MILISLRVIVHVMTCPKLLSDLNIITFYYFLTEFKKIIHDNCFLKNSSDLLRQERQIFSKDYYVALLNLVIHTCIMNETY